MSEETIVTIEIPSEDRMFSRFFPITPQVGDHVFVDAKYKTYVVTKRLITYIPVTDTEKREALFVEGRISITVERLSEEA